MCPELPDLIRRYLFYQLNPRSTISGADLPLEARPPFHNERIQVYHSAHAEFYAPSDPSGTTGRRHELIRSTPCWRKVAPRYDCVLVNRDSTLKGLLGMDVARVKLFFTFRYRRTLHPCALVHWFSREGTVPDSVTGMWIVRRRYHRNGTPLTSVIHLDTIVRAARLIGVCSEDYRVGEDEFEYTSLDRFDQFYVNKFADHHAFDLLHF